MRPAATCQLLGVGCPPLHMPFPVFKNMPLKNPRSRAPSPFRLPEHLGEGVCGSPQMIEHTQNLSTPGSIPAHQPRAVFPSIQPHGSGDASPWGPPARCRHCTCPAASRSPGHSRWAPACRWPLLWSHPHPPWPHPGAPLRSPSWAPCPWGSTPPFPVQAPWSGLPWLPWQSRLRVGGWVGDGFILEVTLSCKHPLFWVQSYG